MEFRLIVQLAVLNFGEVFGYDACIGSVTALFVVIIIAWTFDKL